MVYDDKLFIANKIRIARKKANMTQAELAEAINISTQQVSRIEIGTYIPSVPTFLRIVNILGLSLSEFGVNPNIKENASRDKLIKQICSLDEKELECCINAIETTIKNCNIMKK